MRFGRRRSRNICWGFFALPQSAEYWLEGAKQAKAEAEECMIPNARRSCSTSRRLTKELLISSGRGGSAREALTAGEAADQLAEIESSHILKNAI
jgi:hypothetical protein